MMFDWDNAVVVAKVPVHSTETVEVQEVELHIRQLADLIAGQFSYDEKGVAYVKDGNVPLAITPAPLAEEQSR